MGCSSYVTSPDHLRPSGEPILVQFKYGFLRENHYALGDELHWQPEELPAGAKRATDIVVPGWDQSGEDGYFAITIERNRLLRLARIPETECDEMEKQFDHDGRHGWKR